MTVILLSCEEDAKCSWLQILKCVVECLELETSHIIKSNFCLSTEPLINKGIVQILPGLWLLRALPISLVTLLHAHHLLVKHLLTLHLLLPSHSSMLFPQALSLSQRASSVLPLRSLWWAAAIIRSPLSLPSSGLNTPRDLSWFLVPLALKPFAIFIALLWTFTNTFVCFLFCGTSAGDEAAQHRADSPSPCQLAVLGLVHPRYFWTFRLPGHIAASCTTCRQA